MKTIKKYYVAPACNIIKMETMQFLCASPQPEGSSTHEDLDEEEDNYEW